ncbi:TonB-dependent receptor [Novosphingobium sp. UBA1939]|uniref:TonB-dependent receptor n=1 Tax=Novosphingobium sp. UBA1939 TaxID=1946982 RepID=UPI0025F747E0|nr:TonB-dependent receptor [Novosphingobium sp. UBA1939]
MFKRIRTRHGIGNRLMAGVAAAAITVIAPSASATAQSTVVTFSIARQSLAGALNEVALQSGRQLVLDGALVRDRQTTGLRGAYTLESALDHLLRGTELTYSVRGNTVVIRRGRNAVDPAHRMPAALTQAVPSAGGQVSEPAAGVETGTGSETPIVVTGSRIARKGYDTPQPVAALGETAIQATGVSNVGDILNRMPQVGVGLGQANSYYNGDAGAAFVNLRGLGANRTLVLVNGRRRVSGTELSSAVDLTTIPANMIDKIEVITGGAAAVYGADAVTGVVNVTLKSNVQGIQLTGRSGISSRGDAASYSLGALVGSKFADDRGSVVLGFSYNKEQPLQANQRKFGLNQVDLFSNPANTGPADGIFDSIAVANYRYPGTSYGGAFVIGGTRYTYDQGGVRPTRNDATPYGPTGFLGVGGDGFNDADFAPLRNQTEVFAGTAHLEYQASDAVRVFVDAQYARTKTVARLQPTFDLGVTITADNPLIPADVRALMNAAGQTSLSIGRTNIDQGINVRYIDRDTVTGVAGIEGDLGSRFHWMGFYQYGRYQSDATRTHNRITDRFNQAVDVIQGPNGPMCRDAAARAAGCQPLSLFGPNAATPQALAYFDYTSHRKVVNTQQVAGLQFTSKPFDLPAGPLQLAGGVEYRRETTDVTPDPLQAAGQLIYLTDAALSARFSVKEVFGEVLVPILADRPFAKELSLEGAVRYSDYSSIGGTTAWKVGGQWAPVRDVRFRVTRSRSVRAPNLSELYNPGASSNAFILDPCDSTRVNLTTNRRANCAALGVAANYTDPFAGVAKTVITGGNPGLSAETSNSWTAGTVFTPGFIPGVAVSVDWWKIDLKGAINTVPLQRAVDNCVDAATTSNPFCQLVRRRADGAITQVNVSPINVGSLNAEGIDFQANYRRAFGATEGRLAVSGTYLIRNELQVVAGDPTTRDNNLGEVDNPRWRFNVAPGVTMGRFSLDWTVRFISATKVDSQATAEGRSDNNVSSRLYNDLYASVAVNDRFRLYGGVNNLFDVDPPFSAVTFQGTGRGALFDNIGRYLFVGVNTTF